MAKISIEFIDKIVKTMVYSTEQEVASDIRKKLQEGDTSVSRDDLVALKTRVYDSVLENLNPDMVEYAETVIEDINQYILDKISEEVKNMKDSSNTSETS